jgi:hypothetical protein
MYKVLTGTRVACIAFGDQVMGESPHNAPELFQLAALFRQSAEKSDQGEIRKKLLDAAAEIEVRARMIAKADQARPAAAADPFAPVDFLT